MTDYEQRIAATSHAAATRRAIQLPQLRCTSCGHVYSGAELIQLGHHQHREQIPA
jgi:hypothetical protein